MTPENYEKLRWKIIAACPEFVDQKKRFVQNLGLWDLMHPIRISHVLRALAVETIPAVSIDQDGWLQFYPEEHGVYYNLDQDDLALQSDETKEFLFNLLTPKTDEA